MSKIRFAAEFPAANVVYLAGDFNEWRIGDLRLRREKKGEDTFVALVDLAPGVYEFKYVVDGEWMCCPASPRVVSTAGTENSIVEV